MPPSHYKSILLVALFVHIGLLAKASVDTFRIHTDFPYVNKDEKLLLNVYYASDSIFIGKLNVWFYKYDLADSACMLYKQNPKFTFKKGVNKIKINFSITDSNTTYNTKFYEILKRTNDLPPGKYKVIITVRDSTHSYRNLYLHDLDSSLSVRSQIRKDINKTLLPKQRPFSGFGRTIPHKKSVSAAGALSTRKHKVERIAKKHGLTTRTTELSNKSYVDFFYSDWFAGRYEASKNKSVSDQMKEDDDMEHSDKTVETSNMDHPSLYSQYQKSNKEKRESDEVKGELGFTNNISTAQEQNSGLDNNYYELKGRFLVPVRDIPIAIEGFYTSQDNHREIKSSYFRVHYDVDKMKESLGKSMSSYNTKYSENKSKGVGMNVVYKSAISKLEGQKAALQSGTGSTDIKASKKPSANPKVDKNALKGIHKNKEVEPEDDEDETELSDSTDTRNDSIAAARKAKREKKIKNAAEDKKKAEEKRKQAEELDKKINRYKTLLAQSENTSYFDSSLGYSKTKDVGNTSDMSYKQMAKNGVNLLPDGKAKSFLAGVTTMDAGMFPKSESKYTMSGQMMKGLDFGYDLGFCEAGMTVGKTEYVGRDGSLDKYTFYSVKASCKPIKKQKINLLYYGYAPDRKLSSQNDFFKKQSISAPGYFQQVHIFSLGHEGFISDYVSVNSEAATCVKQSDDLNVPAYSVKDKMAYHFNVDANIPKTAISLEGAYDKTGKGFENSTLPVLLTGTEQYRLAGRNDFFHSFVTAGVEYNYLIQNNFSSKGSNTKWGFDAKTNFKRYPNIALSYKPFTTFRSYTDTLNIPQKPLFGSVWTGKVTYQFKKHQRSYRFAFLYNKCLTVFDTLKYGSKLMQVSGMYAHRELTTTLIIGNSEITGTNNTVKQTAPNKMSFLTLNAGYSFSKALTVTGGQDFGVASFGFCKYSMNWGVMYRFKKPEFIIRTNLRYSTFELNEGEKWTNLYSGNIDLTYRFKMKNNKPK